MRRILLSLALISLVSLSAKAQGWPENYGGVMLQGFYWDSYDDSQWTVLEEQAEELSKYFDLIWVPNSGYCNTLTNFMGYLPIWWFDHKSAFGTEDELRSMISTYKELGTGIIEDVVINHKNGNTDWCDFPTEIWNGDTVEWSLADICVGDDDGETEAQGYALAGAADTGEDFNGGRDLDHTGENVQKNVKIYLDFLLNDLGYIGFRYDMVKGYAPEYTSIYNQYANPTYSVGEYWDGTTANVEEWIDGTKDDDGNIMSAAFDFPLKYIINNVFASASGWSSLSGSCLANDENYRRYAVTFVDNHDTYRTGESSSAPLNANIEAANAFLLAMPGTPCVFLRHIQMYEVPIKKLIFARKAAGLHNMSEIVTQTAETDGFILEVKGINGSVLLLLGEPTSASTDGYSLAVEGTNYQYYVSEDVDLTGIDDIVSTDEETVVPDFCTMSDDELCAFFEKPSSWTGTLRCWAWNSTTNFTGGSWPGVTCSYVGSTDEGLSVYKWAGGTLGDDIPTGIIFNSNSGNTQTNDFEFVNGGYYDVNGLQAVVSGVSEIKADDESDKCKGNVYSVDGRKIRTLAEETTQSEALDGLSKGVYIVGGKKFIKQ